MYTYSTSTRILYDARYRRLRAFIIGHVVNERLACVRVVSRCRQRWPTAAAHLATISTISTRTSYHYHQ